MKLNKNFWFLPLALLLAGWSGAKPEDTLEAVADVLCETGDILRARPYLANPEAMRELEQIVDMLKQADPQVYEGVLAEMRTECAKTRPVEILDVEINGDQAEIRYRQANGERGTDQLQRKDGKWMLVLVL